MTLGRLAAGLAHELNNPAAAATRAVDALQTACAALLSSEGRLARNELSAEQFAALDALRRELEPQRADPDPLARSDREQALSSWLAGHGIEREWAIALPLAAAGADPDWCARAATVLEGSALGPGLEWVASTLSVATLLGEVKESTRRISELVAAVRSYSQLDRASMQRLEVTDGLDSTLAMLGHKLGDGVTVLREYGADVPRIEASAGELNQVWTNLIDNALDAMDGTGTLRVATRSSTGTASSSRSATPARGCRRRWRIAPSSPSSPPRTWAKAPASASTSHGASSWSATAARSPSTPGRARPSSGSASRSGGPPTAPERPPPGARSALEKVDWPVALVAGWAHGAHPASGPPGRRRTGATGPAGGAAVATPAPPHRRAAAAAAQYPDHRRLVGWPPPWSWSRWPGSPSARPGAVWAWPSRCGTTRWCGGWPGCAFPA